MNFSGTHWLTVLGAAGILAVIGAVLNFEKKLWTLALTVAIATFFFVIYVIGS